MIRRPGIPRKVCERILSRIALDLLIIAALILSISAPTSFSAPKIDRTGVEHTLDRLIDTEITNLSSADERLAFIQSLRQNLQQFQDEYLTRLSEESGGNAVAEEMGDLRSIVNSLVREIPPNEGYQLNSLFVCSELSQLFDVSGREDLKYRYDEIIRGVLELKDGVALVISSSYIVKFHMQFYKYYRNWSREQSINTINTVCRGRFGISFNDQDIDHPPTFYSFQPPILYILGRVEDGFSQKLRDAVSEVERDQEILIIAFGSGGGNVEEALRAAKFLRNRLSVVTLYGDCESACPLVFAGGSFRSFDPAKIFRLGFHKMTIDGVTLGKRHGYYAELSSELKKIGIDGEFFIDNMLAASPDKMHYPNKSELVRHGVINYELEDVELILR